MPRRIPWITFGGLALLGGGLVMLSGQIVRLDATIKANLTKTIDEDDPMQTLEEDVTRGSDDAIVHVTTVRNEGESVDDFVKRHKEVVDAIRNS